MLRILFILFQGQICQGLVFLYTLGHQLANGPVCVPEGHPLFREIICTVGGIDKAL